MTRLELQPLIDHLGLQPKPVECGGYAFTSHLSVWSQLAAIVGTDKSAVHRARREGLTLRLADRWAVAAGTHPALVWDEYLQVEAV